VTWSWVGASQCHPQGQLSASQATSLGHLATFEKVKETEKSSVGKEKRKGKGKEMRLTTVRRRLLLRDSLAQCHIA